MLYFLFATNLYCRIYSASFIKFNTVRIKLRDKKRLQSTAWCKFKFYTRKCQNERMTRESLEIKYVREKKKDKICHYVLMQNR
jgi:hypothetical protein